MTKQNCTDQIAKRDTMNDLRGAILIAALALVPAAAYADGPAGTQRYVEVRGAKLYTQIYGRGPPIVFLHGGMAFFDISFAKQRDYFATSEVFHAVKVQAARAQCSRRGR